MLSKEVLKASIRPLFAPATMPKGTVAQAVFEWCTAYIKYAQSAQAGAVKLIAPLIAVPASGQFFSALDSAFRTMWTAVAWAGPGLVGATAVVPPLMPPLIANSAILLSSRDADLALNLTVDALHKYTLSITVIVTPPVGTPFIVPLL